VAKNTGSNSKKRAGTRNKTARARQPSRSRARAAMGRNSAYILIIMVLVTALVLLVNRFYDKTDHSLKKNQSSSVSVDDRNDKAELKKESERAPEKSDNKTVRESKEASVIETPEKEYKPAGEEIKLYFIQFNQKTDKMYLSPVVRRVEKKSVLENTMKELIKGPTPLEKKKGLLSAVPADLKLNSVKIKNRIAELDFNSTIERGASGSILLNRIDQIVYTATQFPTINSIIIKINGRSQQSLGSDGLSIEGPLQRRR
jgi:spore germination protein GerM